MGASRDKNRRRDERIKGTEKHMVAARKKLEKQSKTKLKYTIVGTLVGLFIIAVLILNTNLLYTGTTAVTVGDQKYSTAEFNYYYTLGYYGFMNTYGDYASYFFDTSQPLRKQEYGSEEFKSWADYFKDQAFKSMIEITALYEKALAEGYSSLSEQKSEEIEMSLADYSYSASQYGYPDTNSYLSAVFGKGFSADVLRGILIKNAIASEYAELVSESFVFSPEELYAWYEENRDTYDRITYTYYYISNDADDLFDYDGEAQDEDNAAAAESLANEIAARVTDAESFKTAVLELTDGAEPVTVTYSGGDISYSDYADWLLSDGRKSGDVTVTESESGYYVLLFGRRDDNRYNTVSVRHVLIKAAEDENGEFTDEAKEAALLEAERLLEEWKGAEATEESFAELAALRSEDDGSRENGGLYEDIYKGMMVEEFDTFCFGPRSVGDTAIVYGENDYYAGYHIMFFVGKGEIYGDMIAEGKMRVDAFNEWENNLTENYSAVEKFPLAFRKKM